MGKGKRNISIRAKILVIPMIIIFLAISILSGSFLYIIRTKLLDEMRNGGMNLVEQIANQLVHNKSAMDIMDEEMNNKIKIYGRIIMDDRERLNDGYLKNIAQKAEIDEINISDIDGKVIYSNQRENLGYIFDEKHPGYGVLSGQKTDFTEEIRKSKTSEDYYKYGYVSIPGGGVVQIGILANKIQKFSESISMQLLMEKLAKDPGIVYALYIDTSLKAIAHSNKDRINIILDDEGSRISAVEGKPYSSTYFYDAEKVWVYQVLMPLYKGDKLLGAVKVGLSMENVNKTITKVVMIVLSISIVTFLSVSFILLVIGNNIIRPIKQLGKISNSIAECDLTGSININSGDEIGVLAKGFGNMTKNLRESMKLLIEQAVIVKEMSDSLAGNSNAMAATVQEVATAVNDVAKGASDQSSNMEEVAKVSTDLTEELNNIYDKVTLVKSNSQETEDKAIEGKKQINDLFKSIEELKRSFEEISLKINSLNSSVSQVGNITKVINSISEQTNLLALNAAIEAARAGDSGRGFAVVAEEIRKLAEQSKESTGEIQKLISSISSENTDVMSNYKIVDEHVKYQFSAAQKTMDAFDKILTSITNIVPLVEDTYISLNSTIHAKDIVIEKIDAVASVAEEASASSEQIAASAEELLSSSEEIANYVQELKEVALKLNNNSRKFII